MNAVVEHRKLGEILRARGRVEEVDVERVLAAQKFPIGHALIESVGVTGEDVAQALAEQSHMPYVNLADYAVVPELFKDLSVVQACQMGVLPLRATDTRFHVAIADPFDLKLIDRIERIVGRRVQISVASDTAIAAALKRSEGALEILKDVSEDFRLALVTTGETGDERSVSLDKAADEDTGTVVQLINTLMLAAIQRRASDVHIETYARGIVIKYRVDGVLYAATEWLDRKHHSTLIARLKVMAELDIAEKRTPQDGRFKLRHAGRNIDCRLSVLPSVFGEDIVIRILDKTAVNDGAGVPRLDRLGIDGDLLKQIRRIVRAPYGMMLITGPTGSGKTTTLYAALSELDVNAEKIITIEDPVEYQLDGIVQIPVNERKGLTFAKGLRSVLRHDPDKIMVGEIRDAETAKIAVQSALTGHLVFSTVHANSAIDAIWRFSHMGIDLYDFVSALKAVVAQRLVRLTCKSCRQPTQMDVETLEMSGLHPPRYAEHIWQEGQGCEHCGGTGYRGRTVVAELLVVTPQLRQLIVEKQPFETIRAAAMASGMHSLRNAAISKALAGETTLKEVNRVTLVD